jgi:transcriptional regulator with XRE-family HTH domain
MPPQGGLYLLTGEQIRAGRALLHWEQATLAERSGVSTDTIKRLEKIDGPLRAQYETVVAIQRALEFAGIQLLDNGGIRRVASRNVLIAQRIAKEIEGFVMKSFDAALMADPELFDHGDDRVINVLANMFKGRLGLKAIVSRILPSETPAHGDKSAD